MEITIQKIRPAHNVAKFNIVKVDVMLFHSFSIYRQAFAYSLFTLLEVLT